MDTHIDIRLKITLRLKTSAQVSLNQVRVKFEKKASSTSAGADEKYFYHKGYYLCLYLKIQTLTTNTNVLPTQLRVEWTAANLGEIGQIFVQSFLGAYFYNVGSQFDFGVGVELVCVAVALVASVPYSAEHHSLRSKEPFRSKKVLQVHFIQFL